MYICKNVFIGEIIYLIMRQYYTVFAVALLMLCSCGGRGTQFQGWTDTIPVEIMVVNDKATNEERSYVGDIGSDHEVTLSFMLGGTLTKVAVKNGQHVAQGQVLAEVDATRARSIHTAALATLRQAEDAHRRLEALHREGGLSEVKWVEMETNLEKARQTELTARKSLEDCAIRAPFAGVVAMTDRHVGQEMKPAEPFARLLDMGRLRVNFSVPEQDIVYVKVGDTATATVPSVDNGKFSLRVSDKSLIANPLGHTYKVQATIERGQGVKGLLPDMVAKVRMMLGNAEEGVMRVTVAADCVQTMPEGTILWVVKNGKAEQRKVKVGDFTRNNVVIDEGLETGDTVVVAGYQKLYTGAKVRISN